MTAPKAYERRSMLRALEVAFMADTSLFYVGFINNLFLGDKLGGWMKPTEWQGLNKQLFGESYKIDDADADKVKKAHFYSGMGPLIQTLYLIMAAGYWSRPYLMMKYNIVDMVPNPPGFALPDDTDFGYD